MADETTNLVLEHLRHIRGAVDALREDMRETKARLGRLEVNLAQTQVGVAELSVRLDRLDARVERIEARLDLAEV